MKRIMTKATMVLFALLLLGMAGCASKQDLQTIEVQRQHDRQRVQELEKELENARQALKDEISAQNDPVRSSQANIWAEMEQLRRQVGMLDGRLDAMERTIDDRTLTDKGEDLGVIAMQVEALRFAMEHQLGVDVAAAEAKVKAMNPPAVVGANGEAAVAGDDATAEISQTESAQTPPSTPADPADALYDRALNAFRERKYDAARQDWAEFVKTFPKNAKVSNAVFWQGECYYQMGQYGKSILAYQDIIDKYKKSSKYRAALLKQGMAFHKLGKPGPGKLRLESLIKDYPDSPEAARAKQFLKGN